MAERAYKYTDGSTTTEQVGFARRCRLWAVRPNVTTTGTVTLRKGATGGSDVFSISAIGLTQAGKSFDGLVLESGFTIQLSAGSDICLFIYEPF